MVNDVLLLASNSFDENHSPNGPFDEIFNIKERIQGFVVFIAALGWKEMLFH